MKLQLIEIQVEFAFSNNEKSAVRKCRGDIRLQNIDEGSFSI